MNNKNLKKLAACAALLFTFLFAGCAQHGSSDTMGDSMDTMMEEKGTEMNTPPMNEPMKQEPMMNEMDKNMGTIRTAISNPPHMFMLVGLSNKVPIRSPTETANRDPKITVSRTIPQLATRLWLISNTTAAAVKQ